jgi:hypothetical protein
MVADKFPRRRKREFFRRSREISVAIREFNPVDQESSALPAPDEIFSTDSELISL